MALKKETEFDVKIGVLPEAPPVIAEMPSLTMAEMKELEAQAHSEIQAEMKARLKSDFLAKTKSEFKKKALFRNGVDEKAEVIERIMINLPKFSDRITLDGVIYFHGLTYSFGTAKAATIKEVMNRQWMHHAEINGLDMNEYLGRKAYHEVVKPKQ